MAGRQAPPTRWTMGSVATITLQGNESYVNFESKISEIIGVQKEVLVCILVRYEELENERAHIRAFSIKWPVGFSGTFKISDIRPLNMASHNDQLDEYKKIMIEICKIEAKLNHEWAYFKLFESLYDKPLHGEILFEINLSEQEDIESNYNEKIKAIEKNRRYLAITGPESLFTSAEFDDILRKNLLATLSDDVKRQMVTEIPNWVARKNLEMELVLYQSKRDVLETALETALDKTPVVILPKEISELDELWTRYTTEAAKIVDRLKQEQ